MASVMNLSPGRWVVYLASQSASDSEVTVELKMSRETAKNLAYAETCRLAALNPERDVHPSEDVGSAVLGIMSSIQTISRVKERLASSDQEELMDLIDNEVDAVRASRP